MFACLRMAHIETGDVVKPEPCPVCWRPVYKRHRKGPVPRYCSTRCQKRAEVRRHMDRRSPSEEYPRGNALVAALGVWSPADGPDPD
jgi:hypothetical protein